MNVEKILIEAGVSNEYIEKLKTEKLISIDNYRYSYDQVDTEGTMRRVPVEQIVGIGTSRGRDGISWLDNVNNSSACNFKSDTIQMFLEKIINSPLEELRNSFISGQYRGDNLKFVHYKEEDVYFCTSGGSHRTLFSKLTGTPEIEAIVYEYKLNPIKKSNYLRTENLKDNLKKICDKMNFTITREDNPSEYEVRITYDENLVTIIREPSIYSYTNFTKVTELENNYTKKIQLLESILSLHNELKTIPLRYRKLILMVLNYFNKYNKQVLKELRYLYSLGWEPKQ